MPYAVVFSGGGALGSWEVGCYRALLTHHGGELPACVTGASAGALNAAAITSGMSADEIAEAQAAAMRLSGANRAFSPAEISVRWRPSTARIWPVANSVFRARLVFHDMGRRHGWPYYPG